MSMAREARRAAEPPLGNPGSSSGEFSHQAERERRYLLRSKLRKHARTDLVTRTKWVHDFVSGAYSEQTVQIPRDDRFLACGQRPALGSTVTMRKSQKNRAGYGNLQACGSVWACPCCSPKIMKQRADDLQAVLAWARREGHTIAMITLTMRHLKRDSLDSLWDLLSKGWARVTSGKGQWNSETPEDYLEARSDWESRRDLAERGLGRYPSGSRNGGQFRSRRIGDQERYGVLGFARAVEVTYGAHGWHPHVHAVVILENTVGGSEGQFLGYRAAKDLGESMFERWQRAIPGHNRPIRYDEDGEDVGLNVTINMAAEKKLADYLTKDGLSDSEAHVRASVEKQASGVALEATHGMAKRARKAGSRTPFQILSDLDYDRQDKKKADRDLASWLEWLDGSAGRRQITWSKGLRDLAGLAAEELTDEELAEQDDEGDVVLTLPPTTWKAVRRDSWILLNILEHQGVQGVTDYLDNYVNPTTGEIGLEYGHPTYERMTEWAENPSRWGDECAA